MLIPSSETKMNPSQHSRLPVSRMSAPASFIRWPGLLILMCLLAIHPACSKKKAKASVPQAPPAPTRVALLPFSIPAENSDLRWVSLVAPMIMAKTIENSQNFEAVPLWQSYPVALESLGGGRSITPEVAAYVASRVGAKWATAGELNAVKGGVWMRVDFVPAKANLVPYRFDRETHLDGLAASFHEAFSQFGRYLVMRPMAKFEGKGQNPESLRPLAEALDREYGWYTAADPGKSDKLVADLQRTDAALAKLVFNPSLYSALGTTPGVPKPVELRATGGLKSDVDAPTPGSEAGVTAKPGATPSTGTETTLPVSPARKGAGELGEATLVKEATAAAAELVAYQIQVYSTQRKEAADAKAASLAKEGYNASVEQVEIKDRGTWYRIRLQGFKSRADAKAVGDKLVADKLIKQYWIVPQ